LVKSTNGYSILNLEAEGHQSVERKDRVASKKESRPEDEPLEVTTRYTKGHLSGQT